MKKKIAIIGGGTAALFLAAFLDERLFDVTIYEKQRTLGRKFLVAGDGGFNLTHAEEMTKLANRYAPVNFLKNALLSFSNQDMRDWLSAIGIETYVGSSQRIFPIKGIKPIQVLRAMMDYLAAKNVRIKYNYKFIGWNEQRNLVFNESDIINSDYNIFALGGASWSKTGSNGRWLKIFENSGIETVSFSAQNCAFEVNWNTEFVKDHAGQPLKNIAVKYGGKTQKGELVITEFGLEGNAIYAMSPKIQATLAKNNAAIIYLDLKPSLSTESLYKKLHNSKQNISTTLRQRIKLSTATIALLKNNLSKDQFLNLILLSKYIKRLPIELIGAAPIDKAISTSGGVCLSAVNSNFELLEMKHNYCIGEMLDWSAPTGGYLIQGCASMGFGLATHINSLG